MSAMQPSVVTSLKNRVQTKPASVCVPNLSDYVHLCQPSVVQSLAVGFQCPINKYCYPHILFHTQYFLLLPTVRGQQIERVAEHFRGAVRNNMTLCAVMR